MGRVTGRRRILRIVAGRRVEQTETLTAEEPLEIRVDGKPLSVTMRTPGHDFDLVAGFLTTEGVIGAGGQVMTMRYCCGKDDGVNHYNVVDAALAAGVAPPSASLDRNFFTSSSCGMCGKASMQAVRTATRWPVENDPVRIDLSVLAGLPDTLRAGQAVFDKAGGLHAAGLFDAHGQLLCLREDVGRHNAVDKVMGWAARENALPLRGHLLMVSGRASFELVQKAVMAGIPVLAAISAPSALAVDLAQESGMTLVGFLRGETMNVYSGAQRLR